MVTMHTDGRIINLIAMLSLLAASAVVYDLSGKSGLVVTDGVAVGLYRLWRGHETVGEQTEAGGAHGDLEQLSAEPGAEVAETVK